MTTTKVHTRITARDVEVLRAIDRCPLTTEQLLRLSGTFSQPFTQLRLLRRRLQRLCRAGWIRRWPYAIAARGGTPDYFRLTLQGYRILAGPDAKPPTKRSFSEIGVARHHHTRCLADFLVQTFVSVHHHGFEITDFFRENTLVLEIGRERIFPDAAFTIESPDGNRFNFYVELDNGSERVRSTKDGDSIERKVERYDRYETFATDRHRVLFVATRSQYRLNHILETANAIVTNPNRSLFYGVTLPSFLERGTEAIVAPCFLDHHGKSVAMVPVLQANVRPTTSVAIDQAATTVVA